MRQSWKPFLPLVQERLVAYHRKSSSAWFQS